MDKRTNEIVQRIKKRREELGLSYQELADRTGMSKSTLQRYETGDIANIPLSKISALANGLKTTQQYIMGWENNDEPAEKSNISYVIKDDVYNVPVFESVSAGFGAYADDQIVDYIPTVINNPYEAEDTIAIRVKGDSMYPKIEDGDTIIVRKQPIVDSGQIAVVLIDDEGFVKQIRYGKGWIDLVSLNPEYKTRHFEGEEAERIRIVGLVRQVVKIF